MPATRRALLRSEVKQAHASRDFGLLAPYHPSVDAPRASRISAAGLNRPA
jgi:hypothetical protein